MIEVLYGIQLVRVKALDGGAWKAITTPQQATISPQVIAGQRVEIRGGDRMLTSVEDPDKLVGMEISFTDATMDGSTWEVIDGGDWDVGDEEYTPKAVGDPRPRFEMEVYQARFTEGSQHDGSVAGYIKYTFPNCSGSVSSFTQQDRQFSTPQFTIKAADASDARCYSWEKIANLPS